MISLTPSFHHHMSPRSLLNFFFPHTSSNAFRTSSLKVFHKSGASVLTSSFTLFSNLTLVRFSSNFQIFLLIIRCFLITFFRTFLSRSTITSLVMKFPWNHFHISYMLSVFFSHKHKINFCFTSTGSVSDFFLFVCLIKPSACHAQLFFITELQQFPSFCISFPNSPVYIFKTLSTFPQMSINIPQRNNDLLELPKSHSLPISSIRRTFSASGLPLCGPYAHIMRITSLPKVSTIAITLSLFLLTSTTFPDISSFTKNPTFLNPASFPDYHSLYLRPEVPTKRAS